MGKLYLRDAAVTIGGRRFTTRITFNVEKTSDGGSANKAKVDIYNLSNDSRGFVEQPGLQLRLEAGYAGELTTLFIGDTKRVKHARNGPDIVTTVESGDGEVKLVNSHVEVSLAPNAKLSQIIDKAVAALGLAKGVVKDIPNITYTNGFTFSGPARDLLDQVARRGNLQWSVQWDALNIFPEGSDTGEAAVLLNDNTGLLNLPNKTEKGFELTSL
ncbi:MAG: hypothetical protein KAT00_14690, partial [Planctomycetes bacterium]|nr:hypothetical protein [Planctomycetota bacterium]